MGCSNPHPHGQIWAGNFLPRLVSPEDNCQKQYLARHDRLLLLDYLGEIQSVEATFGNILGWPMSSGAYFDRNLTAGGVTFDGGIHVLDLVVWLFGEVRQIQYQDDSYGGVEANGVITGSIEIGGRPVPCTVATSWSTRAFCVS